MSTRYAVAPTPPAGPGEHPEDRAVDHYLSELARWRMRREHEWLDYLEQIRWNKQPPAPTLPQDVVAGTLARYIDAYERITGRAWPSA